jgi:uncharacterized lipoprotein YbaY
MKLHIFILSLFLALMAFSPTASAQSGGNQDIGGIIDDIFNGRRQAPGQTGRFPAQNMIDNIPVEIRFDPGRRGLPDEAMLIVSAYAPPKSNVRRRAPLMIGETRLLLDGLDAPINLVIAAPSQVTQNIDYARIEARIVDFDGKTLYEMRDSGEYRGIAAPIMDLQPIGSGSSSAPVQAGFETVSGSVDIAGGAPAFRGSTLVVRLVEDGLAGASNPVIAGEKRIDIDGLSAPFNFDLERELVPGRENEPLTFEVWIEDWANRKTHDLSQAVPYAGPTTSYRLRLNQLTGSAPAPSQTNAGTLQGEARFDAYKGLPAGSVLIVELERVYSGNRPQKITETQVLLDGMSGDIPFELPVSGSAFDPGLPTPILRARIEDKDGNLFFSNPGGTPWFEDSRNLILRASPRY